MPLSDFQEAWLDAMHRGAERRGELARMQQQAAQFAVEQQFKDRQLNANLAHQKTLEDMARQAQDQSLKDQALQGITSGAMAPPKPGFSVDLNSVPGMPANTQNLPGQPGAIPTAYGPMVPQTPEQQGKLVPFAIDQSHPLAKFLPQNMMLPPSQAVSLSNDLLKFNGQTPEAKAALRQTLVDQANTNIKDPERRRLALASMDAALADPQGGHATASKAISDAMGDERKILNAGAETTARKAAELPYITKEAQARNAVELAFAGPKAAAETAARLDKTWTVKHAQLGGDAAMEHLQKQFDSGAMTLSQLGAMNPELKEHFFAWQTKNQKDIPVAYSEHANGIVGQVMPTINAFQALKNAAESSKDSNAPFASAGARLAYALGISSDKGVLERMKPADLNNKIQTELAAREANLTQMISIAERQGWAGASLLSKSRNLIALQQAMKHYPNFTTDSGKMVYEKTNSILQNLYDVAIQTQIYGRKTGIAPTVARPPGIRGPQENPSDTIMKNLRTPGLE